jgi:hypothetical protein
MKKLRNRIIGTSLLTLSLCLSLVSYAHANSYFTAGINYGCSRSYIQGTVTAGDSPGAPVYEYTRVYFELYENGVFRGSKQDDGYPDSGAQTEYCTHPSSSSYWMPYNIYRETDSGEGDDFGGNEYWP